MNPAASPILATYLDSLAPVLVLTLDQDVRVTECNAYAQQILPMEQLGRPFTDWLVELTARKLTGAELLAGTETPARLSLNTASRVPETFLFHFFPVPDGHIALGSPDIAQQRRLGETVLGLNRELSNLTRQLHQANAELKELNQLKNTFLGMAAHDLRKPIGAILAYVQFVLDEAELGAEHREFLAISHAAAADMKRLVDNFLDLAVIEANQLRLDLANVRAADILDAAMVLLRPLAQRKAVTLVADASQAGGDMRLDAAKLQQVLLNLAGNAVEHSQGGQQVTICLRRAPKAQGEELRCEVHDEGAGIDAAAKAHLFEAFAQAGSRKTGGERATGLGLSIARRIVEAHGGRIGVDSVPGQGACFWFTVPVTQDPSQKETP
jgi:signal transduction histidine kinase